MKFTFTKINTFVLFLFLFPFALEAQETQIRGFNDVEFGKIGSDTLTERNKNHGFQIGQFDLYITSQISDRISFLGETVFEWNAGKNNWALDIERAIIKYSVRDYLNISAGKFYTPLGYWNSTYNHGAVIQPTINRPAIIRFEDEGGYLPVHQVGVQLTGTAIGARNFGYTFFVSNGQAEGDTGGSQSYSTSALSGRISIEPVENLQLTVSAYTNRVAKGSYTYQGVKLVSDVQYALMNGAVSYFGSSLPIEFVTEYFYIRNKMLGSHATNAMYAYIGFPIKKKFVPYIMYNKVSFESGEEYFIKNNIDEVTIGSRLVLAPRVVLKLEFTSIRSELFNHSSIIQTQVAFGF
jgi:hypothetical protein